MPLYEYRCEKCGDFEKEQAITEAPLESCPTCGNPVKRLISRNVGLVFKGSGFHITDYVYKNSSESTSENKSSSDN
ncbi:MAG: zinc ribbon domain-containing protein [Thermosediminibacteraceae bacterium]|nr:zinc ribbon domain-containing protein [Thermosediminibacteraceae bacterium]